MGDESLKTLVIVNPVAGGSNKKKKEKLLEPVKEVFQNYTIDGWETESAEDLVDLVREKIKTGDYNLLISASGDGTFLEILNSGILEEPPDNFSLGFLPLGTGNALQPSLDLPKRIHDIAESIRDGEIHHLDLISFNGIKGFFGGVGIDAAVLAAREKHLQRRRKGLYSYVCAIHDTLFRGGYKREHLDVTIDGKEYVAPNILSLIVTKIPYWGMGLKVVPKAKLDDGKIHLYYVNSRPIKGVYDLAFVKLGKTVQGSYGVAENITINSKTGNFLFQIHGDLQNPVGTLECKILDEKAPVRY